MEDPRAERILMGEFKAGETIYVDAQNGEMAFTTEIPEDGGEVLVATIQEETGETPSVEDQDAFDKIVGE